jgi:UDP-N-acetylglucosamine--N-acetylmuramyl-(pentapeptide) pyrophosphoryl-undecaprenol N-acetylglucosamine transferase
MRLGVAGGGTGGHIYPAVAVVEDLKRAVGEIDVIFIGSRRGMEGGIVPGLGYRMHRIVSRPLPTRKNAGFFYSLLCASVGFIQSTFILACNRPHVIVGTGGYASGPVVVAARLLGIPVILIEPNSVPGRAIMMLSRYADEIALGFKETVKYFARGTNLRVTGVPIRDSLIDCDRSEALRRFDLACDRKTIFVFGGSRGASSINKAVIEAAEALETRSDLQFLIQTGAHDYRHVADRAADLGMPCRVFPYIEDMGLAYAVSDLVVCRAGAGAVAEITACGLPAILVPYPYATARHQESNARLLAESGAAFVIHDRDLSGDVLARTIVSILDDPDQLGTMSRNSRSLGRPGAASEIASRLVELARKKGRLSKLATVLADLCSVR